jgi:hypothetical protein
MPCESASEDSGGSICMMPSRTSDDQLICTRTLAANEDHIEGSATSRICDAP